MRPETATLLSDLISNHGRTGSAETYSRFLEIFRQSRLGVVVGGIPDGATGDLVATEDRPFSVGLTTLADGRRMALAFADPEAFARRFGVRFNAVILGEALLSTVLVNPECEGVLVNSATDEVSIIINRATAESQVRGAGIGQLPRRKAWWQFW